MEHAWISAEDAIMPNTTVPTERMSSIATHTLRGPDVMRLSLLVAMAHALQQMPRATDTTTAQMEAMNGIALIFRHRGPDVMPLSLLVTVVHASLQISSATDTTTAQMVATNGIAL